MPPTRVGDLGSALDSALAHLVTGLASAHLAMGLASASDCHPESGSASDLECHSEWESGPAAAPDLPSAMGLVMVSEPASGFQPEPYLAPGSPQAPRPEHSLPSLLPQACVDVDLAQRFALEQTNTAALLPFPIPASASSAYQSYAHVARRSAAQSPGR